MKRRQSIKLQPGAEIMVNGLIIRATSTGLQINHPNAWHIIEDRRDIGKHLFAGIGDDVVLNSTICIGTVGSLANSNGWPEAVAKAQHYLKTAV